MSWRLYQLILHLILLLRTESIRQALLKVILVHSAILIKYSVGLCYGQIFEGPKDPHSLEATFAALNGFAYIFILKRSQEVIAPEVLTHEGIPENLGWRWMSDKGIWSLCWAFVFWAFSLFLKVTSSNVHAPIVSESSCRLLKSARAAKDVRYLLREELVFNVFLL